MTKESATTTAATSTAAKVSSSTFHPSSSFQITKLNQQNYHLWRAQILPYLRGQGLHGYINGTIKAPAKTVVEKEGDEPVENPAYVEWERQDSLILSTITSSISDEVLMHVYHAETSAEIWSAISTCFASQSRAKLMQIRTQLASTRKGNQSVTEYYVTIKKHANDLAMAGHPLSTDDVVVYLVASLGPEYDALVTMISARDLMTLEDAYSLFLTTEARLQNHSPSLPPPSSPIGSNSQNKNKPTFTDRVSGR